MNVSHKRGNTDAGAVFPLPGDLFVAERVAWSTWLRGALISRCSLRCATSLRCTGRRSVPPVSTVSAAVSSSEGGIWGVSDPLCHPPNPVPGLDPWGSLTPGMGVAVVRQNRARSMTSPSEPRVSRTMPLLFPSSMNTTDRFCPETCVHIGERAPPLNQRLRRSPTVTSCLSSNPRVSFVR